MKERKVGSTQTQSLLTSTPPVPLIPFPLFAISVWYTGFKNLNARKIGLYSLFLYCSMTGVLMMSHGIEIASFFNYMNEPTASFIMAWKPIRSFLFAALLAMIYSWTEEYKQAIPLMNDDGNGNGTGANGSRNGVGYSTVPVVEEDFEVDAETGHIGSEENGMNWPKIYLMVLCAGGILAMNLLVLAFGAVSDKVTVLAGMGLVMESIQMIGMGCLFGWMTWKFIQFFGMETNRTALRSHAMGMANSIRNKVRARSRRGFGGRGNVNNAEMDMDDDETGGFTDLLLDPTEKKRAESIILVCSILCLSLIAIGITCLAMSGMPPIAPDSWGFLFFLDIVVTLILLAHVWKQPPAARFEVYQSTKTAEEVTEYEFMNSQSVSEDDGVGSTTTTTTTTTGGNRSSFEIGDDEDD
eukprot:TRINITY_DN327_c0_g1_i1.p1 TRINITY_DN327_c0_g1~~TRINITY_DN327_c0_g1_i1.p1  ORF type:complete len:411 (-),score=112.07 TRINITY_DN327_c0_g1_i1:28-1260(-)